MLTRIIVNGANGKMGKLACETIAQQPNFELVAKLGRNDDLAKAIKETKAQIVIELTNAECVFNNSQKIIENNVHPVIGATGLTSEQIKILTQKSNDKKLGGIIAPNFSIGAILMMQFAAMAAKYLTNVEIIEAHHPQKLDSPSGTAIKTAEMISKVHKNISGEINDIHIHSLRLPGVLANQQVIFGSLGETLTISHATIDRKCFMPGLILACQKVTSLDNLYYGLENILE